MAYPSIVEVLRRKCPRKPRWCPAPAPPRNVTKIRETENTNLRILNVGVRKNINLQMRTLVVVAALVVVSLWASEPDSSYFQTVTRWMGVNDVAWPTSTGVELQLDHGQRDCQHRARFLSAALMRAENALRKLRAVRRLYVAGRHHVGLTRINADYPLPGSRRQRGLTACGVIARAGAGTEPWRSRAWLWGVLPLPLHRSTPAPTVLLQASRPLPADCWSFRHAAGEVIIELSYTARVTLLSIEHVRPDSTRSAPANFTLYGILANGTRVTGSNGGYSSRGTALQTFRTGLATPVNAVALQVTSNQGNPRFVTKDRLHTAMTQVHAYAHESSIFSSKYCRVHVRNSVDQVCCVCIYKTDVPTKYIDPDVEHPLWNIA